MAKHGNPRVVFWSQKAGKQNPTVACLLCRTDWPASFLRRWLYMNSQNKSVIFEIMMKLKVVEYHFSQSRINNADGKSKACWQTSYRYYLHYEDAYPDRTKDMLILIEPGHNSLITSLKWWKKKIEIPRSYFFSHAFSLFSSFLCLPNPWPGQKQALPFSTPVR